jgi:hypothetical protein
MVVYGAMRRFISGNDTDGMCEDRLKCSFPGKNGKWFWLQQYQSLAITQDAIEGNAPVMDRLPRCPIVHLGVRPTS